MKILFFGLGYVSSRLLTELSENNECVVISRSSPRIDTVLHYKFGYDLSELAKDFTHIIISIPPINGADAVLNSYKQFILSCNQLKWLGYLSSTTVYGNHNGAFVDEYSEINARDVFSTTRAQVEREWLSLYRKNSVPSHIFRLSGIYGPGRSAIDSILNNEAKKIVKKDHYFSRIHVDDICGILIKSMCKPEAGSIYNLSDDLPAAHHEVLDYACDLLSVPHLPEVDYEDSVVSERMKSFYDNNKRVSNNKIKQELCYTLKYPSYKEGLSAIKEI